MNTDELYDRHQHEMEDFWGRRQTGSRFVREFFLFDRRVRLSSNDEAALAAAELSRPLYSQAPPTGRPPISIELIVRPTPLDPGPAPDDLVRHIQYTGNGNWLAMHYSMWGHCQVDLAAGRALAILTPQLAMRPDLVSGWLLNTVFLNLLTAGGLAMLHATCLLRNGRAVLLIGAHNTGKSTTALSLVLAGYSLLSDSQVYLANGQDSVQLMGFPVGRIKLRQDMLASFPALQPLLEAEQVREETKFVLDLRQFAPERVQDQAVQPSAVELCLLARSGDEDTRLTPASREEVMQAVMTNSLHYDTADAWRSNLTLIESLVNQARWHHLAIGSRPEAIVTALEKLWA